MNEPDRNAQVSNNGVRLWRVAWTTENRAAKRIKIRILATRRGEGKVNE
jgi:hypothetical protein